MRWSLWVTLTFLLLPGAVAIARTDPPVHDPFQYLPQITDDPTLSISSAALAIRPTANTSYLLFSGGVEVNLQGIQLSADEVELDILTSDLAKQDLHLPELTGTPAHLVEDPGGVIIGMARELELPRPKFKQNELQRVGARGSVAVHLGTFTLTTDQLVSTDGGRSWSTSGTSTLSGTDPESGVALAMEMAHLLIDTETNRALARGTVKGRINQPEQEEVVIQAETLEINLDTKQITVSESLLIRRGTLMMCCGTFSADLQGNSIDASGGPRLQDSEHDIHAELGGIRYDLDTQELVAFGGIEITDEARKLSLRAGELRGNIVDQLFIVQGEPRVTYGTSSFEGKSITVKLLGDKRARIEVAGPQAAEIYLDELPSLNSSTSSTPDSETDRP